MKREELDELIVTSLSSHNLIINCDIKIIK